MIEPNDAFTELGGSNANSLH